MKKYLNCIQKKLKYVGKNFAKEERSIHYDKKKEKKNILNFLMKLCNP